MNKNTFLLTIFLDATVVPIGADGFINFCDFAIIDIATHGILLHVQPLCNLLLRPSVPGGVKTKPAVTVPYARGREALPSI